MAQTGTKRKGTAMVVRQTKRPRVDDVAVDVDVDTGLMDGPFFQPPSKETMEGAIIKLMFLSNLIETDVGDMPNPRHLVPDEPHAAQILVGRYLLRAEAMAESQTFMCLQCKRKLVKDERPPLALANWMWVGRPPLELLILRSRRASPDRPLLSGDPATIGVTFVGAGNAPLKVFPYFLHIRRERVFEALVWLKENNALYADIEHLTRPVEAAAGGCARPGDTEGRAAVGTGDHRVRWIKQPIEPIVIPLQAHGVMDVQGDSVPETERMAHALANVAAPVVNQDFLIRKSSAFVNEYARKDADGKRFDGGPENANHMLGAFPVLFPYGKGGMEVERTTTVPYETHVPVFGCYPKAPVAFMKLKVADFVKASAEEARRVPFSNPVIRALRKQLTSLRARVPGYR
ncbi:hypothetical protein C8F04DRAFT_1198140 [Mycena alexandri]|uniref:DUF6570 domain-containing protein n=1 Tax=Mycena alexandri TaxID=1745969 RepID=A0AAD6S0L7_9AGAR|nr:hypothetical protein C8F04DRAFT_1198140 [Mycena alexandri]